MFNSCRVLSIKAASNWSGIAVSCFVSGILSNTFRSVVVVLDGYQAETGSLGQVCRKVHASCASKYYRAVLSPILIIVILIVIVPVCVLCRGWCLVRTAAFCSFVLTVWIHSPFLPKSFVLLRIKYSSFKLKAQSYK